MPLQTIARVVENPMGMRVERADIYYSATLEYHTYTI